MENKLVWAEYLVDHLITLGEELEKLSPAVGLYPTDVVKSTMSI